MRHARLPRTEEVVIVAASACRLLDAEQWQARRDALADARRAVANVQPGDMMLANDRFRQIWLDATPTRRLAASISRFVDHVQVVRHATIIDTATQHLSLELLAKMLEGFEQRDALLVHDTVTQFVVRAKESFFTAVEAKAKAGHARA